MLPYVTRGVKLTVMRRMISIATAVTLFAGARLASGQVYSPGTPELLTERRTGTTPAATAPSDPAADVASAAQLQQFAARLAALKSDDVEGLLALSRWARDRRLWPQTIQAAQAAMAFDAGNRAAYLLLQQADDARPLPEEPVVEEALKSELSAEFQHEFKTRHSKHFLFCYDTSDAFAIESGANVELSYDAFQFYFTMNTLRPTFLTHRLVVLLFKDREDYLAYIRRTSGQDLSWSGGVYSQATNRSAFFDDSTGLAAASYKKEADVLRTRLDSLNQQIEAAVTSNQTSVAGFAAFRSNATVSARHCWSITIVAPVPSPSITKARRCTRRPTKSRLTWEFKGGSWTIRFGSPRDWPAALKKRIHRGGADRQS